MRRILSIAAVAAVLGCTGPPASAQDDTERALQRYRRMLQDDPWSNPGHLEADRGEALWRKRRGPRNASLEACDLGRGPGRVEGAFAELPRYFRDADRVMDLEARLVWCMETLQGFARADIVERPYSKANQPGTEAEALATYVASRSSGLTFAPKLDHAREREALRLGEACSSGARARWISPAPRAMRNPAGASACRTSRSSATPERPAKRSVRGRPTGCRRAPS